MSEMRLFHGSSVEVNTPRIVVNGYYKDFGYGFYCTYIETQAKRWALTKFNHPTHQIAFCTEKALSSLEFERSYSL